jgi:hypothetical protein
MKPRLLSSCLGAASALVFLAIPTVQGANLVFTANLSGAAEDPPVPSPGSGFVTVTYDPIVHTLRVEASFADLIGTTTVAHIHSPTAVPGSGNIGVAVTPGTLPGFPVGVTSGTYDQTLDLTVAGNYTAGFLALGDGTAASAEVLLIDTMSEGRAYFNIHTSFSPGGEIRGFLTAESVPEPSSALAGLLAAAGLTGLKALRRRQ